jgi:hypothetical protein
LIGFVGFVGFIGFVWFVGLLKVTPGRDWVIGSVWLVLYSYSAKRYSYSAVSV